MAEEDVNESGQGPEMRPATAADVTSIEALVERAYAPWVERIGGRPGPMHHDYAQRVEETDAFVVDADGELIGLLILIPEPDHLLLENVAVDPQRQGEGIGRTLMAFAEERARDAGLGELRLFTHQLMSENIALYERLGYQEDAELGAQDPYGRVFMTKRLG